MTSDEVLPGTRKPSARRSKPDMAALVDQHKFVHSAKPKKATVFFHGLQDSHDEDSLVELEFSQVTQRNGYSHANEWTISEGDAKGLSLADSDDLAGSPNGHEKETDDDDDDAPLSTFVLPHKLAREELDPRHSHTPPLSNSGANSPPLSLSTSSANHSLPLCHHCGSQPVVSDDVRWDGPYCSADCVVKRCRQAFTCHVTSKRTSGGGGGGTSAVTEGIGTVLRQ